MTTTIPLRPLDTEFRTTLEHALAQRDATRDFVARATRDGVTDVVFVGVGGSYSSSIHATFLLQQFGDRTRVANLNAAEFVDATPRRIGPRTLVVASSHGGRTPETVQAARVARERRAPLVSLSSEADTPLARLSELALTYGNDRTITSAKQILLAGLAADMLRMLDGVAGLEALDQGLAALPLALEETLTDSEARLAGIARELHDQLPVWVVGSGSGLGAAYTMSICHLVEMQWIPSAYFAAGDYFHGPFELLTEDAQLLVFAGEDATRPETDRVSAFAQRVNRKPHVVDTASLSLPGVPADARGLVSGIVLGVLGSRLLDHVETARGHDLDVRRYMHVAEY